jgi:DNA topoisomerase-3
VPEELRSAELTARWEEKLMAISRGRLGSDAFVGDMRRYAAKLVAQTIASTASYAHDNATREKCPDCGKALLDVKGKKGKMLVCPDRACGYRKSVSVETNARCPNCHKKLELRGEGEKRLFVCVCGHREKLSDFERRRVDAGAGKRDVQTFLGAHKRAGNFALADQLARWKEQ